MKRLWLALILLGSCQSKQQNEQKYCALATAEHVYDPKVPGLCHTDYNRQPADVRTCLDDCVREVASAHLCVNRCIPQSDHEFHPAPRGSR